jgi:RimJ/RimL family protein N-acetyltransferase
MRDGRAALVLHAEPQPAGLGATEVQVRGMLPGEADAAIWPAEIAVTIVDDWQGRGLGTALLTRLSGRARCEGIHRFTALVAEDNTAMAGLLRNMSARSRRHCRAQGADRRHRHTPGRLAKIPPLWAPSGDARGKRRLVPSSQNIPSPDQR